MLQAYRANHSQLQLFVFLSHVVFILSLPLVFFYSLIQTLAHQLCFSQVNVPHGHTDPQHNIILTDYMLLLLYWILYDGVQTSNYITMIII